MKKLILVPLTLIFGLTSTPAIAGLRDLCDDYYLGPTGAPITDSDGTKLSRFCQWAGPDAPVWADHVCCQLSGNDAACTPTDANGRCVTGFKMWCDYASESAGKVTCYQPFQDACDAGLCVNAPAGSTEAGGTVLCCVGANCWELKVGDNCPGNFFSCDSPFSNEDGTVGCADDD